MGLDKDRVVFQGGVYLVDLSPVIGSEQGGIRPCVCVSNDSNNIWSNTAQFVPLTSRNKKTQIPTHHYLPGKKYRFLKKDSIALAEQITCKSTQRIKNFLGKIDKIDLEAIQRCICAQLGM